MQRQSRDEPYFKQVASLQERKLHTQILQCSPTYLTPRPVRDGLGESLGPMVAPFLKETFFKMQMLQEMASIHVRVYVKQCVFI